MRNPLWGTWFAEAKELEAMLSFWQSIPKIPHIAALIVPHAGYAYCGPTLASAYSSLQVKDYDQVILLAPSHRIFMPNAVSIEPAKEIINPLGNVILNADLSEQLLALPGASYIPQAHQQEHSLYIQLPMLGHFFPHCQIAAMLVGHWDFDTAENKQALSTFAQALRKLITKKTLLIISTDFTHYGENFNYTPFTPLEENIAHLDHLVFYNLCQNSNQKFSKFMHETQATICGKSALQILLALLPTQASFHKVHYSTSGSLANDWSHSVSYMSLLVEADWTKAMKKEIIMSNPEHLSPQAQEQILRLAASALDHSVRTGQALDLSQIELSAELTQLRGAFVTLHKNGQLRGCIGEILPQKPLALVITERTRDSALKDSRFPPVTIDELAEITIDISVLGIPEPIDSWQNIVLGIHGIILQKDGQGAVFLPQVATEQNWDLPTTLSYLAMKAGFSPDAWQEDAEFFVFTAQVIK